MLILEGHSSLVGLLEFSGQYLVSAAADATLRVWSPETGKCLSTLTGHNAAITCFHHDPKNNRIVSGSDGGVKVWELSSAGYKSSITPPTTAGGPGFAFTQGPNGAEPVHGRFIGDLIVGVQGVWRTRMDERRLVCAVQRDGGRTWFEVLDFGDGVDDDSRVDEPAVAESETMHTFERQMGHRRHGAINRRGGVVRNGGVPIRRSSRRIIVGNDVLDEESAEEELELEDDADEE